MLKRPSNVLPTFEEAAALVCQCELGEVEAQGEQVVSWLDYCEAHGIYHYLTADYAAALAESIRKLDHRRAVEVAAGQGALSLALGALGLDVTPTDAYSGSEAVTQLTAAEALAQLQPDLVIASWPPIDSGIDAQVMACPSVRRYIYIGHEHNGIVGHEGLWRAPGWRHRRLDAADAVNLGRTDFCADFQSRRMVQHGWTVLFERTAEDR